jgi:hypothetical protein
MLCVKLQCLVCFVLVMAPGVHTPLPVLVSHCHVSELACIASLKAYLGSLHYLFETWVYIYYG